MSIHWGLLNGWPQNVRFYIACLFSFYFVPETIITFVKVIIIMKKGEKEKKEEMEGEKEEREEVKTNGVETLRFRYVF